MAGDTNFFVNFPKRDYRFGTNEAAVQFQDLSVYIDLFDQVKEYSTYYESYQIQNNERPDHVSHNLYGTTDHYWTFWLLNDHLRLNGWPMDNWRIFKQAKAYYPHIVCMTLGSVYRKQFDRFDSMSTLDSFKEGALLWFPQSREAARIVKLNHNLGQIWIEMLNEGTFPVEQRRNIVHPIIEDDLIVLNNFKDLDNDPSINSTDFVYREALEQAENVIENADYTELATPDQMRSTIESERTNAAITYEWEAIHRFEDLKGNTVFPDYLNPDPVRYRGAFALDWSSVGTFGSVTYLERLQAANDQMRSIEVIKADAINDIVNEFKSLLKTGNDD